MLTVVVGVVPVSSGLESEFSSEEESAEVRASTCTIIIQIKHNTCFILLLF